MKINFSYKPCTMDDFIQLTSDCTAVTTSGNPREIIYYNEAGYNKGYKIPTAKAIIKKAYWDTNSYYEAVYV